MTGSGVRHNLILIVTVVVYDRFQRGPRILNVIVVAPQVTVLDNRREIWLNTALRYQFNSLDIAKLYFELIV